MSANDIRELENLTVFLAKKVGFVFSKWKYALKNAGAFASDDGKEEIEMKKFWKWKNQAKNQSEEEVTELHCSLMEQ